ncbi:lytic transglycosylase domain-containing protein [Caballeronia temeraria]|nr:lytic transglycosylase domain-containing protein [Caballeronia temeraria]
MDIALDAEGASPQDAAVARSIYQQESGSGKNTKTSNADAHGGMQIIPATFKSVADKGWDINDPVDNARAGVRYIKQLSEKAGGDPSLTAVGYYGGPGAIDKAQKGVAVSDPRNPNAPNTLQYGQQVAGRIEKGTWWENFPLADASTAPQQAPQEAPSAQVATGAVQAQDGSTGQPAQAPQGPQGPATAASLIGGQPTQTDQFRQPTQQETTAARNAPQPGFWSRVGDGIEQMGSNLVNSPLETIGNAAHGAIDGLTFGLADKAGAALNAAVNPDDPGTFSERYHNALGDVQQYEDSRPEFTAGQLGSAFVPGAGDLSLIKAATEAVPVASRTARAFAGGAAGMTEGAAQVLGHANYLDDVTPGQLATGMGIGLVGGGLGGALTKATDRQLSNSFLNKAGTVENGQRDAQIISDLQAIQSRAAQDGAKLGPADANALARRYTQEAADSLRQVPKTEDRQTLLNALQRARGLSDDQVQALRKLPNGDAVADAIQMHQRTLTLTAPTPANLGKMTSFARMLVDNGALHAISHTVPGGSLLTLAPVRHYVMGALLGGRENRTANIASALEQGPMAQAFLKRFGQGTANQSAQDLAQAATAAQAARAAAQTAGQDARGFKQGDSAFQRAQQAAQQARQQAAAANPMTPEAQAAAREYMFRAQQAGQANRAGMAQEAQRAAQAEASVGPQMNANQRKAAQAYAAQQAQQAEAMAAGPQIPKDVLAARVAEQQAQVKAVAEQQAARAKALAAAQAANAKAGQAATANLTAKWGAERAAAAPQAVAAEATQAAPGAAHVTGISPSKRAQQNLALAKAGQFDGLDFNNPRARMMLAHIDYGGDPEKLKTALKELANEDPDTAIRAIQTLTPDHPNAKFLGAQAALQKKLAVRVPSEAELADIPGSAQWKAARQPAAGPSDVEQATQAGRESDAWHSSKESRQIIQKQALANAQDPEVQKLVAKLIDTKNVKGAKDPNVNRREAFDKFMKTASTPQQIEAKRVAEILVSYGK